jgi:RNA polymerase-binding transcription factor DksA
MSKLTKKELQKFEKMLLEERERLVGNIRSVEETSRNESVRDTGADLSSYAETGTDSFEIETQLNIASAESDRLKEIDDALARIARGTYGICEGSGKPIPKKRLEVFPAARYTVEYQEEIERQQRQGRYR